MDGATEKFRMNAWRRTLEPAYFPAGVPGGTGSGRTRNRGFYTKRNEIATTACGHTLTIQFGKNLGLLDEHHVVQRGGALKSVLNCVHSSAISAEGLDSQSQFLDQVTANEAADAVGLPAGSDHDCLQRRTRRLLQEREDLAGLRFLFSGRAYRVPSSLLARDLVRLRLWNRLPRAAPGYRVLFLG